MKTGWSGYAWALGATAASTLAGLAMRERFDLVNIAMVYLLAVVIVALACSRGPAIVATLLSVATFDLLFVPPRGAFTEERHGKARAANPRHLGGSHAIDITSGTASPLVPSVCGRRPDRTHSTKCSSCTRNGSWIGT